MTDYTEHLHENLAGSAVARIKKGGARAFKAGGLWIYDNEIDRVRGTFEDGDIISLAGDLSTAPQKSASVC